MRSGDKFTVTIPVTNTGERDGMETVFWYVSDPYGSVTRPDKELRHFEKKLIRKGETSEFQFNVNVDSDLCFVDSEGKRLLEPGEMTIIVGDKQIVINIIK